jgi:hypothetical protein
VSSSPDIEIYLHDTTAQTIIDWLLNRFPETSQVAKPAGKHQWRITLMYQQQPVPTLIIENASVGYSSLWLDSSHTPWVDDQACAREAFQFFQKEIRATPGSWHEGDDPDLWWSISARGEALVQWPD